MKQRKLTFAAIGCGLVCAACVALFMASVQGEANAARAEALARFGGEQVEACVATRDIASGERVDASAVETRLWVADLLPEGAVVEGTQVIGQTTTSSILKGEVVCDKRFEKNRDAIEVPVGKEAVSVPARAVRAVGGAIRPGMLVDVYSSGGTATAAIARGVAVLDTSVGEGESLVSSDSGWITLAIEPEKVEEVVAASNKTDLYFVLPGEKPQETEQAAETAPAENPEANAVASAEAPSPGTAASNAAVEPAPQPSAAAPQASASAEKPADAPAPENADAPASAEAASGKQQGGEGR